jgi:integrase
VADYYPLVSRAAAALELNTFERRRAVYNRARTAQASQLSKLDPPADNSVIARERQALEKAISIIRSRDRSNAQVRFYFRRRGRRAIPLPGLPGSDEFMSAYAAALAAQPEAIEIGSSRTAPGTVNALCVDYYRSQQWKDLGPDTKRKRWRIIEAFRLKHGDKRVALLRREHVQIMLAAIAKPSTRRDWFKAIRGLLRFAVPTMLAVGPTEGIPTIKLPKSKGHHTWTDDEIERYRAHWPLGTQQRLVMEFALETASRKGEVVRLGPQHVRDGRIRIERTHGSEDVDIPISPEVQAACDAMPKPHLTYIVTAYGKPRSKYGLGNDFAQWATAAGVPARCRLHGLKKSAMRRLAEAGNTAHELMAISGHKTLSEVQRYTSAADRKRLAGSGMAKMREGTKGDADYTNIAAPLHKQSKKPA